jgi:DNA-binding transcriptional MerR regulator
MEIILENRHVCKLIGIGERESRYWSDKGIIVPEIQDGIGKPGVSRRYSFRNLVEFGVLHAITKNGINLKKAKEALELARKERYFEDWPEMYFLVIRDGDIVYSFVPGKSEKNMEALSGEFRPISIKNLEIWARVLDGKNFDFEDLPKEAPSKDVEKVYTTVARLGRTAEVALPLTENAESLLIIPIHNIKKNLEDKLTDLL